MEYIPILRLGTIEAKLLQNEINGQPVFPLLEVTNTKVLQKSAGEIARHFKGEYMVDLPMYLLYTMNKYTSEIDEIINSIPRDASTSAFSTQTRFYVANRNWIKIPVASAEEDMSVSYDNVLITYNELKAYFPKIAVRLFVSHIQLTQVQKAKLKVILDNLREGDIILLDVIGFEGIEQPVLINIQEIIKMAAKNKIYLLNAFDIRTNRGEVHNYSPVLAKSFKFAGFGDFVTSYRYEPTGGMPGVKIIRYYIGDVNNKLVHFVDATYTAAFNQVKNSNYWKQAAARNHNQRCLGCTSTNKGANDSPIFWKKFRILHYIFSILHDTLPRVVKDKNPQDTDPDGFANLYNKTNADTM
jgi:hypothetical protein